MAIYHYHRAIGQRKKGHNAVFAAAYIRRESRTCYATGETKSFEDKGDLVYKECFLPDGAPAWATKLRGAFLPGRPGETVYDESGLVFSEYAWNQIELVERRQDARPYFHDEFAIPIEMNPEQAIALVKDFAKQELATDGFFCDVAIHWEAGNPHAHALMPLRRLTETGFSLKRRFTKAGLSEEIKRVRAAWAAHANRHLLAAGFDVRIDHRSYAEQGINLTPTRKVGKATHMKGHAIQAARVADNLRIRAENYLKVQADPDVLAKQLALSHGVMTEAVVAEGLNRYVVPEAVVSVVANTLLDSGSGRVSGEAATGQASGSGIGEAARQSGDDIPLPFVSPEEEKAAALRRREQQVEAIIECLETEYSILNERTLKAEVLAKATNTQEYQNLLQAVLSSKALIAIGLGEDGRSHYVSRSAFKLECELVDMAQGLQNRHGHFIAGDQVKVQAVAHGLNAGQQAALLHITAGSDIALVRGMSGTGKTYLMKAAKAVWEAEGYRVLGVGFLGRVAAGLEAETEIRSRTIDQFIQAVAGGYLKLSDKDIVVMDEMGMTSLDHMHALLKLTKTVGAKFVAIGDLEQTQSTRRGAATKVLVETVGSAVLDEILRQKVDWQRDATFLMETMQTAAGLDAYASRGHLHWCEDKTTALDLTVSQWFSQWRDNGQDAFQEHMMVAYRNDTVNALNRLAREQLVANGHLALGERFQVASGMLNLAVGDRVRFSENNHALQIKNGHFGEILKIEYEQGQAQAQFTVRLDDGQEKSFDLQDFNHFTYGYAATIHKMQGYTGNHIHLYVDSAGFDRHLFLVGASRHRLGLSIIADRTHFENETVLASVVSRDGLKDSVFDFPAAFAIRRGFDAQRITKAAAQFVANTKRKIIDSILWLFNWQVMVEQSAQEMAQQHSQKQRVMEVTQARREAAVKVADFCDRRVEIGALIEAIQTLPGYERMIRYQQMPLDAEIKAQQVYCYVQEEKLWLAGRDPKGGDEVKRIMLTAGTASLPGDLSEKAYKSIVQTLTDEYEIERLSKVNHELLSQACTAAGFGLLDMEEKVGLQRQVYALQIRNSRLARKIDAEEELLRVALDRNRLSLAKVKQSIVFGQRHDAMRALVSDYKKHGKLLPATAEEVITNWAAYRGHVISAIGADLAYQKLQNDLRQAAYVYRAETAKQQFTGASDLEAIERIWDYLKADGAVRTLEIKLAETADNGARPKDSKSKKYQKNQKMKRPKARVAMSAAELAEAASALVALRVKRDELAKAVFDKRSTDDVILQHFGVDEKRLLKHAVSHGFREKVKRFQVLADSAYTQVTISKAFIAHQIKTRHRRYAAYFDEVQQVFEMMQARQKNSMQAANEINEEKNINQEKKANEETQKNQQKQQNQQNQEKNPAAVIAENQHWRAVNLENWHYERLKTLQLQGSAFKKSHDEVMRYLSIKAQTGQAWKKALVRREKGSKHTDQWILKAQGFAAWRDRLASHLVKNLEHHVGALGFEAADLKLLYQQAQSANYFSRYVETTHPQQKLYMAQAMASDYKRYGHFLAVNHLSDEVRAQARHFRYLRRVKQAPSVEIKQAIRLFEAYQQKRFAAGEAWGNHQRLAAKSQQTLLFAGGVVNTNTQPLVGAGSEDKKAFQPTLTTPWLLPAKQLMVQRNASAYALKQAMETVSVLGGNQASDWAALFEVKSVDIAAIEKQAKQHIAYERVMAYLNAPLSERGGLAQELLQDRSGYHFIFEQGIDFKGLQQQSKIWLQQQQSLSNHTQATSSEFSYFGDADENPAPRDIDAAGAALSSRASQTNTTIKIQKQFDVEIINAQLMANPELTYGAIFGEPKKRSGREWRYGNGLIVTMHGRGAGKWYSFSECLGGGPIKALQFAQNLSYADALKAGMRLSGLSEAQAMRETIISVSQKNDDSAASISTSTTATPIAGDEPLEKLRAARIASAESIWAGSLPIAGTLAEQYFTEHRGVVDVSTMEMRYWPAGAKWLNQSDENTALKAQVNKMPAVVIAARDHLGELTGVQRIYLDKNTATKNTFMGNAKLSKGVTQGSAGVVQVGEVGGRLYVAEGPETCASIALVDPQATVLASLGVHNLGNLAEVVKSYGPRECVIAADFDGLAAKTRETTIKAFEQLRGTLETAQIDCRLVFPQPTDGLKDLKKIDWNDVLKVAGIDGLSQQLGLDDLTLSPDELYYHRAKPIHYTLGAHYLREKQGLMGVGLSELRFMPRLKLADGSRHPAIILPLVKPTGEAVAECVWCLDAAGEAISQSFLRGETKGAAGVLQQGQAGESSDVYIVSDVLEGKALAMGDPQATILLTTARYRDLGDLKAWLDQRGVKIRSINLVVKEFNAQQVEWMLTQTAGLSAEKINWYIVKGRDTDQGVHAALLAQNKVNITMYYTERMGLSQAAAKYLPAKQQATSLFSGLKQLIKTPKTGQIKQIAAEAKATEKNSLRQVATAEISQGLKASRESRKSKELKELKESKFYYLPDKAQRQALQDYFKACDQLSLKNDAQNSMAIAKAAQGVYAAFEKEVRAINFHAQPIKKVLAASSLETIKKRVLHHQVLGLDDLSALLNEVAQPKLDQATQMAMQGVLDITRDSERANLCFEKSAKIMAESAKLLEAWLAEPLPDNEVLFNMSSGKAIDCSRLSRGEWMGMVKGIQGFAETHERVNASPTLQHERSLGLRLQDDDSAGGMHF